MEDRWSFLGLRKNDEYPFKEYNSKPKTGKEQLNNIETKLRSSQSDSRSFSQISVENKSSNNINKSFHDVSLAESPKFFHSDEMNRSDISKFNLSIVSKNVVIIYSNVLCKISQTVLCFPLRSIHHIVQFSTLKSGSHILPFKTLHYIYCTILSKGFTSLWKGFSSHLLYIAFTGTFQHVFSQFLHNHCNSTISKFITQTIFTTCGMLILTPFYCSMIYDFVQSYTITGNRSPFFMLFDGLKKLFGYGNDVQPITINKRKSRLIGKPKFIGYLSLTSVTCLYWTLGSLIDWIIYKFANLNFFHQIVFKMLNSKPYLPYYDHGISSTSTPNESSSESSIINKDIGIVCAHQLITESLSWLIKEWLLHPIWLLSVKMALQNYILSRNGVLIDDFCGVLNGSTHQISLNVEPFNCNSPIDFLDQIINRNGIMNGLWKGSGPLFLETFLRFIILFATLKFIQKSNNQI